MIEKQIGLISEAYIVSLTNKGMYKRALKAMEKEEVSMHHPYTFKVGSETLVFKGQLEKFDCTCSATGYCKHVVMSYLYLMNKEEGRGKSLLTLADFDIINQVTSKELKTYESQQVINDALIAFDPMKMSYKVDSFLRVTLNHTGHVNLTYPFNLQDAFKQHEEKDLIIAIKYIQHLKGLDHLKVEFKLPNRQVLEEIKTYFETLLAGGLYNLKESEVDALGFLSIKLRLEKYNFLSKKVHYLKKALESYFKGHLDTPFESMKESFIEILLDIYVLLGQASDEDKYRLFRKRAETFDISEVTAYGLGYEMVDLANDNRLINVMLLDRESGRIYELSNLRKKSYLAYRNLSSMALFVQDSQSAYSLMDKTFSLKDIRVKAENRIANDSKIALTFKEEMCFDPAVYGRPIKQALEEFLEGDSRCFIVSSAINPFYNIGFREAIQRFEIYVDGLCTYYTYENKKDDKIIHKLNQLKQLDHLLVKFNKKDFYLEAKIIALWTGDEKIILGEY